MKWSAVSVAIALASSLAMGKGDTKQCKQECNEFVKICEQNCVKELKKRDPKSKLQDACKKNCGDFVKQCEKGCENGEL